MKNLLIVHEYEKIFATDCEHFDELVKFAEARDFLSLGWQYVQAKNYVGVIHLPSDFQIEILPKLDAPEEKLRKLVMKMICTLKDFKHKKFLDADLNISRMNLYEIFIRIYLEMILELVKRGLKSSYVTREENLNLFKGKLLVKENIRCNVAHREKFFVAHDEYNLNRAEHRLIKTALLKIRRTTRENFRLANRLLAEFDYVEPSINYRKDFAEIFIDKQNHEYKNVIEWTKIFLADESFTSFAGRSRTLALLFPMERLFEDYVAEHVKKYFSDRFTVKTQAQEEFLFDAPRRFGLKPDIILEDAAEKFILDTKWKFEISNDDMYQMFAYAKRYDTTKIFLLCPPGVADFLYRSADFEVQICCVDVFNMANIKNLFCKEVSHG